MKQPIEKHKLELKELQKDTSFKKINCPSCNNETPASDINIQDKIAKCTSCNVVFSIEENITSLLNKPKLKQEVIRPEGIDIFHFGDDLDITIQQPPNALDIILAFFFPFFAIITTLIFLFPGAKGGAPPLMVPTAFWLLSIFPIFNILNRKNAKIHIVIEDEFFSIFQRPKKFIKDKDFDTREIDQIYIKKSAHLYSVWMIINGIDGQKHINIIKNLSSSSKARFLEQEIEKHLEIEDKEVPDEV